MGTQQGTFKVWWDNANKLIRMQAIGRADEAFARGMASEIRALRHEHGDNTHTLSDMTQATGAEGRARQIFADLSKEGTGRTAFFGVSLIQRVILNMVTGAAGASNRMKQFATEAEALAWLKR